MSKIAFERRLLFDLFSHSFESRYGRLVVAIYMGANE